MQKKPQEYLTATDKLQPSGFLQTIRLAFLHYGFLGSLARYIMLHSELRQFMHSVNSRSEKAFRRELLQKFCLIQKKIPCAHSPYQFVLMANYILNLEIEGPIVQCGCFKGGSTAKLSLLAQRTQRRLYVCDSFAGLPPPKSAEEMLLQGHSDFPNYAFSVGEYKGLLGEVKENIKRYGCLEVCEFIPGLFSESLVALDVKPAFVFIDVDLVSSARDCLKYLWPRLIPNGYWFTHEAVFPQYILGILDTKWWRDTLGECPPVIMGAGSGLSPIASGLAYFQKRPR